MNQGFDEFMNVVLDDAEEVYDCGAKPGKEVPPRRELGMFDQRAAPHSLLSIQQTMLTSDSRTYTVKG